MKLVNDGTPRKPDWQYLWDHCLVDEKAIPRLERAKDTYLANIDKYMAVEKKTGVPCWFVAGLHMRESGFNFKTCLHNGQPWNKVTTIVPKGLGPWASWEEAAIDALYHDKMTPKKTATIAKCLDQAFRYNGIGYLKKEGDKGKVEYSPYVCAYTNWHDETSKYVADGYYDPDAEEKQLGVMAFWKYLEMHELL